jgi:hypothetical protein
VSMNPDEKPVPMIDAYADSLKYAAQLHCHGWPGDDGPVNEYEGVRQVLRLAAAGILCFVESNPDYPELVKQQTLNRQVQLPSPDAVYHYARLHGRHSYRIRGNRGSAFIFQITSWSGSCSNFKKDYKLVGKIDNQADPKLAPDAEVDIALSAEPQEGTWLRLPPGECEIYLRQYYADWDRETPAMLTIERLGATYPPPPVTREQMQERMSLLNSWLRVQSEFYKSSVERHLSADRHSVPIVSIPEAFQDVVYSNGAYRCAEGEAVIMELTPPRCLYWNFQIANLQWEPMEFHQRQTSINCHQAVLDDDGVLRVVISHQDPGVPNWFDTNGRKLGLIAGRYFKSESAPVPTLKRVPFADVHDHLRTSRRVTSAQRQALLRRRQASAFARLAGDQ